jgi:acyl-coenzyme A thioesterase PaaI-like protein
LSEPPTTGAARSWILPGEVDAQWTARRRLAAALRELSVRCVTTEAAVDALDEAARAVEALAAAIPPGPTAKDAWISKAYFADPTRWVDRGALMGQSNPVAPPMHATWDGARSTCWVTLSEVYVGAPGMVHGGVIAACFDQVCGHAVVMSGASGFTTQLSVRYRRPTPLDAPLRFEAWITGTRERRLLVESRCFHGDDVLASCEGTFASLDPAEARAIISR